MNLSGSLGAFGLGDVFALLAMTSKSGALRVRRPSAERPQRCGVVRFTDGAILGAASDEGRQALVRRLVGAGLVEDAALSDAVQAARSGGGVARALLDSGAVDAERLRGAAEEQVVDGVFELLQWTEGDFEFSLDEDAVDDVDVRIGVEDALSQARAREDAWREAVSVVPSVQSVLSAPVRRDDETFLSPDEWAVVTLVDGNRTVADLVELTGRGDFGVMTIAADLVRRGILVVRDEGQPDHVGIVARRLALLAPLETTAVRPAAPRPSPGSPSVPARGSNGDGLGVVVPDSPAALMDPRSSDPSHVASGRGGASGGDAATVGATAIDAQRIIERDPSVNRSMLLRVIAGVKGL